MSFHVLTGRAMAAKEALIGRVRVAAEQGDCPIVLLVPAQYTLQAELDVLNFEDGAGSFRLQVLSPARLCARVFEQAGWPQGQRIDEQGRVMLLHSVARHCQDSLQWYQNSVGRRGFAERLLAQFDGFKQARVDPAWLRDKAQGAKDASLRRKLMDLCLLYETYESALLGRYLDGEDEARAAAQRVSGAGFLLDAQIFVYGFDMISTSLAELLVALAQGCPSLTLALTLHEDQRDKDLFAPLMRSLQRLTHMAQEAGIALTRECAPADLHWGEPDIRHLERELFCIPMNRYEKRSEAVQISALRDPRQEAEFAAAMARELVMKRGWRWRDVAVGCQNLDETYQDALRRAFAQSDVPLFLPDARPAERHPAALCLLSALRLIVKGWRTDDMVDYLRSGYAPIGDDENDLLVNLILAHGLRGKRLKEPLRDLPEGLEGLEAARERAVAPLLALAQATHRQKDARVVLGAVFAFLEALGMCERIEAQQEALIALEQREWAMEGPQVWGRILMALDQMVELLSDEALPLKEALPLLVRALSAAQVKPLPQSGDAVLCGSLDHMKSRAVRALLVLGLSDTGAPAEGALLSEAELGALGAGGLCPGLSAADRLRLQRLNLKSAISFTQEFLFFSHPTSDTKGAALKPGPLVALVRRTFSRQPLKGPFGQPDEMVRIRLNAPGAARNRLGALALESSDAPYVGAVRSVLREMGELPEAAPEPEPSQLPEDLAERLFGRIQKVSVSRLEQYARCPYQHFVGYGLRPERFREFTLTPQDAGEFYHQAMERFMREHGERLSTLTEAESMLGMDSVTEAMMQDMMTKALGEGAIAQAQGEELRTVARRAAATAVSQLSGSRFVPAALEIDFGQGEASIDLIGGARLGGRIDRLDVWQDGEQGYVRVIDYKTGGKSLSLGEVYHGLQMQLLIYMAAALKQQGGRPAGAFYFNISDGLVDTESRDPQDVAQERQRELRLRGVLLKDEAVRLAMAPQPKLVLPERGDGLVAAEDFELLIGHALMRAKHAFESLREGRIEAQPRAVGEKKTCEYCEYGALCGRGPDQKHAKLQSLRGPEVLQRLRDERESE